MAADLGLEPGARQVVAERQTAFRSHTGQEMGEDNVWLTGRRQEQDALGRIIATLGQSPAAKGHPQAVRGAGAAARTDSIVHAQEKTR